MDPDATLSELRLLVEALRSPSRAIAVPLAERLQVAQETLGRVLALWTALDSSLSAGERLPCDWARVSEPTADPEPITDEEARARLALWGIG